MRHEHIDQIEAPGASHFTRLTRFGHCRLSRKFEDIDNRMATSPASVLAWSVKEFLSAWTVDVTPRCVIKAATCIAYSWLNWLELSLARRASPLDGACSLYFLGPREETGSISARDMLGRYRATDDRK